MPQPASNSSLLCHKQSDTLFCYMFSAAAIPTGKKLAAALRIFPWLSPQGICASCRLYLPQRLVGNLGVPFENIRKLLASTFNASAGHIFIGAAGIAVRAVAPYLRHKSQDPPVIVLDAPGRYAIPILSGHWCGGNSLARHIGRLLNAQAIITTASDSLGNNAALDILIRDAGLKILDWTVLPVLQAAILEGKSIPIVDPCHFLPATPWLNQVCQPERKANSASGPLVIVSWKSCPPRRNLLRLAPQVLHVGAGFRKGVTLDELREGFIKFCRSLNLEPAALTALATVTEKADALYPLALELGVRLNAYAAKDLAAIKTPAPSIACGKRFATVPFSVSESAAILSAGRGRLLASKMIINKSMTFAAALGIMPSPE